MQYRVAPDKHLTLNRHNYNSGDVVISCNQELLQQLEKAGVLVSDEPVKVEHKQERRR